MRSLFDETINQYRWPDLELKLYGGRGNDNGGVFAVSSNESGKILAIVASNDQGWDHVSVSLPNRTPSWGDMEQVKRIFFLPNEIAMQLHVAESNHISIHPNCLHIWRPHGVEIPLPPKGFV
jgi:hypothetical protein